MSYLNKQFIKNNTLDKLTINLSITEVAIAVIKKGIVKANYN